MSPETYALLFKLIFPVVIVASLMVVINAVMSAKEMGGVLGQAVKKVAAGAIIQTILFITYIAVSSGMRGILTDLQISLFFMITGTIGSILLCLGFFEVYRVSKKLKLFTV